MEETDHVKIVDNRPWTRIFQKHFLSLYVSGFLDGRHCFSVYSCIFIEVEGAAFLLTAGHCIKELKSVLTNSNFEDRVIRLLDGSIENQHQEDPLPVELAVDDLYDGEDEVMGYDYGIIGLPEFYLRGLEKGDAEPLTEQHFHPPPTASEFWLLGVPGESLTQHDSNNEKFDLSYFTVRVKEIASEDTDFSVKNPELFYGELESIADFNSIKGMSGGPIFAVDLTKKRYWIAALLSSWRKDRLHICATRIGPLVRAIQNQIRNPPSNSR